MAIPTKVGIYLKVTLEGYHFIFDGDYYENGKWHASSPYIQLDSDDMIIGEWDTEVYQDVFFLDNDSLPLNCQLTEEEISTGILTDDKNTALRTMVLTLLESELLILGSNVTPIAYDNMAVGQSVHGYLAPHIPEAADHAPNISFSAYVVSTTDLHAGGGE